MLFGRFFSPPFRHRHPALPTRRLSLESLESRDCPSQFIAGSVPVDLNGPYADQQASNSSGGNLTVSLNNVIYGTGQNVTISGMVSGGGEGGVMVEFEGPIQGYTTTDDDGSFNFTTQGSSLGTLLAGVVDPDAGVVLSNIVPTLLSDSGPVIQNFAVNYEGGSQWQFTGQVVDYNAAGLTVSFGGDPASLQNAATTTAADGTFSLAVNLTQGTSDVGYATAQVTDGWGIASSPASVYVPYLALNQFVATSNLPVDLNAANVNQQSSSSPTTPLALSANVVYTDTQDVNISGTVSGATGSTLVEFTGSVNGYLMTNADGSFNFNAPVNSQDPVLAGAVDPNAGAAVSNIATLSLADSGPVIEDFTATPIGQSWWNFSGKVADNFPVSLTVNFGGDPQSLQGQSVTTYSDGSFTLQVDMINGTNDVGVATAQVTDDWGMTSAPATAFVTNSYVDQFLPLTNAPVDLNAAYDAQQSSGGYQPSGGSSSGSCSSSGSSGSSGSSDSGDSTSPTFNIATNSGSQLTLGGSDTTSQASGPLTVNYVSLGGNEVLVYGSVTGANAGGAMIEFQGPIQGIIVTNPDGTFSFTTQSNSQGELLASAIDPNAGTALYNVVLTPVVQNPGPQIINFTATQLDSTLYQFSGQVIAASPQGLVVSLGGAPQSLQGVTATANADGSFSVDVNLVHGGNDTGLATAQVTDALGNTSDPAYFNVSLS